MQNFIQNYKKKLFGTRPSVFFAAEIKHQIFTGLKNKFSKMEKFINTLQAPYLL